MPPHAPAKLHSLRAVTPHALPTSSASAATSMHSSKLPPPFGASSENSFPPYGLLYVPVVPAVMHVLALGRASTAPRPIMRP